MAEVDEFGPPEPIPDWMARAKEAAYRELPPMAEPKPATSALRAFDIASAKGVPILGGLATKGDAAADAALDVLKGAVSGPESVAAAPATNILQFLKNQYGAHLKERQGYQELLAKEHPTATPAGTFVGNVAGYAALPGSALAGVPRAAATSGVVEGLDALARGEEHPEALKRALLGAAGGAAGAYIGGRFASRLGHAADEQADLAVTGGTKSAMRALDKAYGAIGGTEAPGERALVLRKLGAVGGFQNQAGVKEGFARAGDALNEQFGALIDRADATGSKIPLESAIENLKSVASKFKANKSAVANAIEERLGELQAVADKSGMVSHRDLQTILGELRPSVSQIYTKTSNFHSPHEQAYLATYKALRKTQDEGLMSALGENAKEVRQYSALSHRLEELAQRSVEAKRGNDPVGLFGRIEKAQGSGEMGMGLLALAHGNAGIGVPMILKGILSHVHGALGKAASPYRANVLTSVYSGLQGPATAAVRRGIPQAIGAALVGGPGSPETPADEFGPPEPVAPLVTKKGK